MTIDECEEVLQQVYGENESKIIDRFMYRLSEKIAESNDNRIHGHMFLSMALADYIDGKCNKIYESSEASVKNRRN